MYRNTFIFVILFLAGFNQCPASLSALLEPLLEVPSSKEVREVDDVKSEENVTLLKKHKVQGPVNTYTLDQEIIAGEIKNALVDKFNAKGDVKIYFNKNLPQIGVNKDDWILEVVRFPASGLEKNLLIGFKVYSDSKEIGEWTVPVRCEVWRDAYVASRQIEQGEKLSSDIFEVQSVNTLQLNQSPVLVDDLDISSFEARKTIPSDMPLLFRDIREQPDVRKGQIVDVVAQDGLLNISMKGQSLEDGFRKEFVMVRNLDSKKKFQAQVIDESTVQVYF